jgi:hypothetical protein
VSGDSRLRRRPSSATLFDPADTLRDRAASSMSSMERSMINASAIDVKLTSVV